MTKKLISDAIVEATNLKSKDAVLLATHVLKRMRESLVDTGQIMLPGIGTFFSTGEVKQIKVGDFTESLAAGSNSSISRAQAKEITSSFISLLRDELSDGSSLAIHGLGELVLIKSQQKSRSVQMRGCPTLSEPDKSSSGDAS